MATTTRQRTGTTSKVEETKGRTGQKGKNTQKCFVLDTNVLLHNPNAIFLFEEHEVVIPLTVIEELDHFKKNNDETGRNARQAIRQIDKLRAKGKLMEGVQLNSQGGILRVDPLAEGLPAGLAIDIPDHRIIGVAAALHHRGRQTVFISKDIAARVKADAIGIPAEDFEAEKVDADWLYTGYTEAAVPADVIDDLYKERQLKLDRIQKYLKAHDDDGQPFEVTLSMNEFVLLRDEADESHTGLARLLADTGHLIPVNGPRKPIFGVVARNLQQTMAFDLLLDDEIRLVSLLGTAGTGKTLLGLAAGMHKVYKEERYEKLLAARPIMPLGRDIGYLPGDKDDKLEMWMQPIFDNLSYLL
ncbi:MAG TPA: PIN domain-containing protein [Phycisphaerales bacterium]|nr:PIN domain-containing protein [Phycisphaerales bacterium]